ncbi:MAG: pyridoxamine 5'-phosphate oxidase family protein [Actinomycetota bacterium]|nr:pyridoxamine 5'-phosphate oxidase family protein [Actinomycetota bacterium]
MSKALAALQDRTFARATRATAAAYPPDQRLTGVQLGRYLDRRTFAVVGSTRPDGRPHAAISSYVRRETAFWLPTVTGSVRERNIRAQPRVTLVVTEGDRGEHVVVIAEGPAVAVAPAEVPADVRSAAGGNWAGAWLRVQADRLLSYGSPQALLDEP